MRFRLGAVFVLTLLASSLVAAAPNPRHECSLACADAITACTDSLAAWTAAQGLCRRVLLKRCRRDGVAACTRTTTTTTLPKQCGQDSGPVPHGQCGGACPPGFYCGELSGGLAATCACFVAQAWQIPCGDFPFACSGSCPGTLTCRAFASSIAAGFGSCLCAP